MGADRPIQTLRLFLASPWDTAEARAAVAAAVQALNADPAYRERIEIELRRWDDPARPVPVSFRRNPQADVVEYTGDPSDCDLLVGLLRHVFGSSLPEEDDGLHYGLSPDGDAWTGTEWEIHRALQAGREVWIWRDKTPWQADPDWSEEEYERRSQQYRRVRGYFATCKTAQGAILQGINDHQGAADLGVRFSCQLREWVEKRLKEPPRHLTTRSGSAVPITAPDAARQAECAYLQHWLHGDFADRVQRYTGVSALQERSRSPEARRRGLYHDTRLMLELCADLVDGAGAGPDAAPDTRAERQPVPDVLTAYQGVLKERGLGRARLAVLGEPGAGKSFSLQRLFCELAERALADAQAPLPLFIALGDWTREEDDFDAQLDRRLAPFGLDTGWRTLRDTGRAVLLLDGLNEIPVAQRERKTAQVFKALQDTRWAGVLVSCRERDFESRDLTLPVDRLTLQPLSETQILDFLERWEAVEHAPDVARQRAEARFWALAAGPAAAAQANELWAAWKAAGATREQTWALFWSADEVPRKNPDIYSRTSAAQYALWRCLRADRRSLLRLASSPFWLEMLAMLPRVPASQARLIDAFVRMAYDKGRQRCEARLAAHEVPPHERWQAALQALAMALQGRSVAAGRAEAGPPAQADAGHGAATRLPRSEAPAELDDGLLEFAIGTQVLRESDGQIHFTHQLLQESLAARVWLAEVEAGRLDLQALWSQGRGWPRNGWEVVAELAAQSVAHELGRLAALIERIAACHPEQAARCWLAAGSPALPEAMREHIRQTWLPAMTDPVAWPRPESRAAIGRALAGFDLDNRSGVGLRPDGLPDIDWVEFNDGLPFIYQDAEHPGLPPFALSRYLVTHRQFQAFVDAADGYGDPRWWRGFEDRQAEAPDPAAWPEPNCPRERVSWLEATAFCRWLTHRLGVEIGLPNERQWERAARGREGWQYPSAPKPYPVGHANGNESQLEGGSNLQRTSAVGLYPQGATREGTVLDMAGNVWEWCADLYVPNWSPDGGRVLRGGSWFNYPELLHASIRGFNHPGDRDGYIGFRVCRASPIDKLGAGAAGR